MQSSDRAGLLYALAGFCTLSIGDAIIKGMAGEWPAPAMAATRYMVGTIVLAVLIVRHGGFAALKLPRDRLQWLRGLAISCSAMGMFLAVWIMPLAEATTIAFTQPIITAVLATIFLNERARRIDLDRHGGGLRRGHNCPAAQFRDGWLGRAFSAAGGHRHGGDDHCQSQGYRPGQHPRDAILHVGHRHAVPVASVRSSSTLAGPDSFHLTVPHWSIIARCAFIGLSATTAQWLIFMGTVKAGAGTVAPMTYGQSLMAVMLGWTFFGDRPDVTALVGAVIIIGAGLYLWREGRVQAQPEIPRPD